MTKNKLAEAGLTTGENVTDYEDKLNNEYVEKAEIKVNRDWVMILANEDMVRLLEQ